MPSPGSGSSAMSPKPASATPPAPATLATPDRQPTPDGQEPTPAEKVAAALAEKAAKEQKEADDAVAAAQKAQEAAEDEDAPGKVQRCPHCRAPMDKHGDENPHKAGCWHCSSCGCCFAPGIKHVRPGTGACALAAKAS